MSGDADRDRLFESQLHREADFEFDESVSSVFDDMVVRSVPDYARIQELIASIATDFLGTGSVVVDLGCSTGRTLRAIAARAIEPTVRLVGIDSSLPMLDRARANVRHEHPHDARFEFRHDTIRADMALPHASVVVLCLVLQFVRPPERLGVVRRIREALSSEGCLLLYEKTIHPDPHVNRLFIDRYHEFKRSQGYTDLEVAQKRIALENVLVPYRHEENVALLEAGGFSRVDTFSQWLNFVGYLARP